MTCVCRQRPRCCRTAEQRYEFSSFQSIQMHPATWIEGRNLTINLFWATGFDNMEAVARDLLASNPELIVAQEFTVLERIRGCYA